MTGTVCRSESKDYYVIDEKSGEQVRCSLKGKFKKTYNLKKDKLYTTDIAAVGDCVEFDINKDGSGVIHTINPRKNYLSRKSPRIKGASYRGERLEQIIAANIDNLFIVSSILEPHFNNKVVDRFIVAGESSKLTVNIIINKKDLDDDELVELWQSLYTGIGYNAIATSVKTGEAIGQIIKMLSGKKSLFWGQSGVGKSSLLNFLFPHLELETGEISSYSDKGTHTTVTSVMHKVDENTFIIDTPGVREIDPFGIRKEDLGHYFIEFNDFMTECRFNTCTHHHEPGCSVIEAVDAGKISLERYDSYLRVLDTIEEDINF
ncbi:MAG: ribosome small subunit-dependent GTPase A [Ignavibacteriaceae bacterium]|nr:ribosome small subunit-dependent GTPase A [Ignavibacteriaceae bacterium]